jgi:exodeoxyribonuclease-3
MKLICWNVNGIRAALKKGFADFVSAEQPDILCLQETKARPEQVELPLELGAYQTYWNSADKAGYSGTAIFTKVAPLEVTYGLGIDELDTEGRVITAEFENFHLVTVYTPNAQNELRRLPYRMEWDAAFLDWIVQLQAKKPVIFCGDLNVAHHEIDLARPSANRRNPGFSDEERAGFDNIIDAGFVDTFRHFHPDEPDYYSWWSYRANARANNVGWRIDYFGVSQNFLPHTKRTAILNHVMGSDHCPVVLELG